MGPVENRRKVLRVRGGFEKAALLRSAELQWCSLKRQKDTTAV